VKPGDGIVFDAGRPEEPEQGGRVYSVGVGVGRVVELRFAHDALDPAKIPAGVVVWKTDDPALRKRLEQSFAHDKPARRTPLWARAAGRVGGPFTVAARAEGGPEVTVAWPGPLEAARKHPLTADTFRDQFGRLGDTPFELAGVELELPDPVMVPKSVLNDLRRQAVGLLQERPATARGYEVAEPDALDRWRADIARKPRAPVPDAPQLHVLVRTLEQLDAVLAWRPSEPLARPATVYCDFEDPRRYREAVEKAHDAGVPVGLAPLRIVKPGEEGFLRQVAGYGADVLLVRNLAGLALFREFAPAARLVGDFALNVANDLTADLLLAEGLERLVPSYDLNWEQLTALLKHSDPGRFEAVVHQHMPMFHMEHCVFAAFLSSGKDWRDCGRPCDRHKVELRDRVGAAFPVAPDAGCRNTVYNGHAQSAAEYVGRMVALGLRHFRVELLREPADRVAPLLTAYARVLAGRDDGRGTWRQLRAQNQLGVTRGTLQLV
jgi:U32 family peptidase